MFFHIDQYLKYCLQLQSKLIFILFLVFSISIYGQDSTKTEKETIKVTIGDQTISEEEVEKKETLAEKLNLTKNFLDRTKEALESEQKTELGTFKLYNLAALVHQKDKEPNSAFKKNLQDYKIKASKSQILNKNDAKIANQLDSIDALLQQYIEEAVLAENKNQKLLSKAKAEKEKIKSTSTKDSLHLFNDKIYTLQRKLRKINQGVVTNNEKKAIEDSLTTLNTSKKKLENKLNKIDQQTEKKTIKELKDLDDNIKIKQKEIQVLDSKIYKLEEKKKQLQERKNTKGLTFTKAMIPDEEDALKAEVLEIHKVFIEIRESAIYDIRVQGIFKGEMIEFINHRSFHIPHLFTNKSNYWRLHFSNSNEDRYYIFLKDFLKYIYETGQNFVIEKEEIELSAENLEKKIIAKTNLKSLIDFRIYTDFLGLINEESNGIINFESNSTFYIWPKSIPTGVTNLNVSFIKKAKVHVNFSRFDNDDKMVLLSSYRYKDSTLYNPLLLRQKAYFNAGAEFDLIELKRKYAPANFSIKARGGILLTLIEDPENPRVLNTEEEQPDQKGITTNTKYWGFGFNIEALRFANFGINTNIFLNYYQNSNIHKSPQNNPRANFRTFSLDSEAFYFLDKKNRENAFFLRVHYESGRSDLSASKNFFNVQFGYRAEFNLSGTGK